MALDLRLGKFFGPNWSKNSFWATDSWFKIHFNILANY